MTDDQREALGRLAYETWQRERGVPGNAHWEMMGDAQEAWRLTAEAVAVAERERIAAAAKERLDLLGPDDFSPAAQALADIGLIVG